MRDGSPPDFNIKRPVNRKRAVIEQQTNQVAVMGERSRIARELHDTVEQGLTGLSLQLKALETSPLGLPGRLLRDLRRRRRRRQVPCVPGKVQLGGPAGQ